MNDILADLYSDTQTRPTPGMREFMAGAAVGDEQRGEDPSVNRLQEMAASLLGQEAAVYLPSGTMCNEIAYRVHCDRGDEIILDRTSHALHFEAGGPAALSGAMTRTVDGEHGVFSGAMVAEALRPSSRHHPRSRLVSIENTANLGGGAIWPIEAVDEVLGVAREHGLAAHMDGARLLNAVVASRVPARRYAEGFDSVWIDLSKGLGAPVGAVLAGSRQFVDAAWRFKHQFGGAMRQAGIIAAAGIYALEHHVDRLAEDHANAKRLALGLSRLPDLRVDPDRVQTNMVYFDVEREGCDAADLSARLRARGVRIGALGTRTLRAVTHLDIAEKDIDFALEVAAEVLAR